MAPRLRPVPDDDDNTANNDTQRTILHPSRRTQTMKRKIVLLAGACFCFLPPSMAQAQNADLAKELSNPIASLISVPFQANFDRRIGPDDDGEKFFVNVQPVVPISINADWNVISRTILPIVHQSDILPDSGSQFGLGDTLQSLFFTPKSPGPGGVIWGVGPALLLPTATKDLLGTQKWAAGPTGVALRQAGPWTYGVLANHLWSFAGKDSRNDISSTFVQPFLAYTTPDAWTYSVNAESTYDWEADDWSVPANLAISKLLKFGNQPVSVGAGIRYWASGPDGGPEGFGARFVVTLLFPKQ